ncbi:NAD-glutamate dehydrogenase [Kocuria koreensis]|jgi:glutamate dehydrogenase|uniref:NAD-glutamate dehydrogenase n=1 Tax=Rothia koreensis TaxID=592378 RepID=A0A7K1LKJ8_9MICC|nr:NAD-glutamate dehydrogenase [Rothia koreensis]
MSILGQVKTTTTRWSSLPRKVIDVPLNQQSDPTEPESASLTGSKGTHGADGGDGESWISTYYQHATRDDVAEFSEAELVERAELHRKLAETREPNGTNIEVIHHGASWILMVVTDDMPFLVSSITAEIAASYGGSNALFHPLFLVHRNKETGVIESLRGLNLKQQVASGDTAVLPSLGSAAGRESAIESWISVELLGCDDEATAQNVVESVKSVLRDARHADADAEAVRDKVLNLSERVGNLPEPGRENSQNTPDAAEHPKVVQEFLNWVARDNFLFFGYKERDLKDGPDGLTISDRPGTGLGILSDQHDDAEESVHHRVKHLTGLSQDNARDSKIVYVTKANSRSTIHRHEYLDYIGIRDFDANGRVVGEYVILGLFSLQAYSLPATEAPLMRERARVIRNRLGFQPGSHSDKTLTGMIEDYPRLEMLQADQDSLTETFAGIIGLEERRRTRLFLRPDEFGRFVSAVVFLPRDRYNTGVRIRIENVLREAMNLASIDFEVKHSASALARLFLRLRLSEPNQIPDIDVAELEKKLQDATRSWPESLEAALGGPGATIAKRWFDAAPVTYRADYEISEAVADAGIFESLETSGPERPAAVRIGRPRAESDGNGVEKEYRLKTYLREPKTLTELLPIMQNLGLTVIDQKPYDLSTADGSDFLLYDFGVTFPAGVDPEDIGELYEDALCAVLSGRAESDSLDRLVLAEKLPWHTVAVLRAYVRYLVQLGTGLSHAFMADTLLANPGVTRLVVRLFESSFDPSTGETVEQRKARRAEITEEIESALNEVPTLDADKMLRALAEVVAATVRTNAYQQGPAIAFKLMPQQITSAPLPRPKYEIWVYSPRVEGVHLRFGDIARGGLRWSDRREDFRTEVLGLVKAQMVKNAVIIPTGAKGGFFAKQLPDPAADREAWMTEGRAAYSLFIRSLLDVTDNLVTAENGEESVVTPEGVVALDGDDTYLVVAADKGTAAFSDLANSISQEYGFWLGDAFASGGSVGYDHKAMGITARGAWESVKRHFAELGIDCQNEEFTAAGIGDMSGDVFGNGMLRSEHTLLVAAFDHRDIFIDPTPDAASSFAERQRLYDLPRSSWQDYDRSLISEGGGVFSRSEKSISLTPEIRKVLGLDERVTQLAPADLVSAILKAPVDLVYNGGIGTYIKASTETNAQVGDKANDVLRVNGADIRARVIGEGGNLGLTQLGRIEAARQGVLVNTDAIDNSAGVETSDREVNIKIMVDRLVSRGLLDPGERASFIEAQTDAVRNLVLETNREQNGLLQAERMGTMPTTATAARLMDHLEEAAGLNRAIEFLPTDDELEERVAEGWGLTGPELAVLTAYVKIDISDSLLTSGFGNDPWLSQILDEYFPEAVTARFGEQLDDHPLRREIICTRVANEMVDLAGITYAYRAVEETGASVATVASAFLVTRELFDIRDLMAAHRELPANIEPTAWRSIAREIQRVVDRATRWLINEGSLATGDLRTEVPENLQIKAVIDRYAPALALAPEVPELLGSSARKRLDEREAQALSWGIPADFAARWARLLDVYPLMDIATLNEETECDLRESALLYYALSDRFDIDRLLVAVSKLSREDRWETLARSSLRSDLYETVAALTVTVSREVTQGELGGGAASSWPADSVAARRLVDAWESEHPVHSSRIERLMGELDQELGAESAPRMSTLSVAVRTLRGLI